jgi:hypothetical protein
MIVRDIVKLFLKFDYSAAISFDYDEVMADNPDCAPYVHSIKLISKIPTQVRVNCNDSSLISPNVIHFNKNIIFDYGLDCGLVWRESDGKINADFTEECQEWLDKYDMNFLDLDEHHMLMLKTHLEMI